jgi:hypothetical protein
MLPSARAGFGASRGAKIDLSRGVAARSASADCQLLAACRCGIRRYHLHADWLRRFSEWLVARPEQQIIVVAHFGFFKEGLGVEFENCEVMKWSLGQDSRWQLMQRRPDRSAGPGGAVTQPGTTCATSAVGAAAAFPQGKPYVLQPQGLAGRPYEASQQLLMQAAVPLSVIVSMLVAWLWSSQPEA